MAFAIARIKKHKASSLNSVDNHNRRLTETINADPERIHQRLVGKDISTKDLVDERLKNANIKKYRKDAVVAVEIVLTASPEYFRPKSPDSYGSYENGRVEAWLKATKEFLKKKYRKELVEVNLHLDEATPHLHVIVVPVVKKPRKKRQSKKDKELLKPPIITSEYKLCAKDMFNRKSLIALQDEYAESLKHLGLERGIHKSKAHHQTIKKNYENANNSISIKNLKNEYRKSFSDTDLGL